MVELPEGEVHLWFTYPDEWEEPGLIESAQSILEAGEIARSERFRFSQHRQLFLASRLLLRTTLSRYAEIAPGAWRFAANEHGKPRAVPQAGVPAPAFNLAHTAGIAVVAVGGRAYVGVDAENRDRRVRARRLVERFFAPEETTELRNLSSADLRERFVLYWTLKEAYIKALGLGLAQPLDSFSFRLTGERPCRIDFSPAPTQDQRKWRFALVEPRPRVVVAVCVAADGSESTRLRCYRASPAGETAPHLCEPLGLSAGCGVDRIGGRRT